MKNIWSIQEEYVVMWASFYFNNHYVDWDEMYIHDLFEMSESRMLLLCSRKNGCLTLGKIILFTFISKLIHGI